MRAQSAFTMVEIAIAIGVIGFALVAIIGILPRGLNVQKDNREETVVGQDGPYFLEAIRNGQQGLDFLTNYVDRIQWKQLTPLGSGTIYFGPTDTNYPWNGESIIGVLSKLKYEPFGTNGLATNLITARVRALNGSAMMQNGANSVVAFQYLLTSEVVPFQSIAPLTVFTNDVPATGPTNSDQAVRFNRNLEARYLPHTLYEVRVKVQWPLLHPNDNATGPGIHYFRAMTSAQLNGVNAWKFFQPQHYGNP